MAHQHRQLGSHQRRTAVGRLVEYLRTHRRKLTIDRVNQRKNSVDSQGWFLDLIEGLFVGVFPLLIEYEIDRIVRSVDERLMSLQSRIVTLLGKLHVTRLF